MARSPGRLRRRSCRSGDGSGRSHSVRDGRTRLPGRRLRHPCRRPFGRASGSRRGRTHRRPRREPRHCRATAERTGARPSDSRTKLERVAPLSDRGPSGRLRERAREAIALQLSELLSREPGARLGDDSDDIHHMRVAVRRLRSILRAINHPGLASSATNSGGIGEALGAVRDADVLSSHLRASADSLSGGDAAKAVALLEPLVRERHDAQQALVSNLDSERYRRLVRRSKPRRWIQPSTCRRKRCTGGCEISKGRQERRPVAGGERRQPAQATNPRQARQISRRTGRATQTQTCAEADLVLEATSGRNGPAPGCRGRPSPPAPTRPSGGIKRWGTGRRKADRARGKPNPVREKRGAEALEKIRGGRHAGVAVSAALSMPGRRRAPSHDPIPSRQPG